MSSELSEIVRGVSWKMCEPSVQQGASAAAGEGGRLILCEAPEALQQLYAAQLQSPAAPVNRIQTFIYVSVSV